MERNEGHEPEPSASTDAYRARVEVERSIFREQVDINNLPQIFHYWADSYVRPLLQEFGASNPDEFFAIYLNQAGCRSDIGQAHYLSLGAGNCDTEVRVAKLLRMHRAKDFLIHCIDINEHGLARGRAMAEAAGVADSIVTICDDFNTWRPRTRYAGVMANQSLHHMLDLERVFDLVRDVTGDGGTFVVSDMIGRNGHLRWPEALAGVCKFWDELPLPYRYNMQLRRQEDQFTDWDCSGESFEGIRAQDILPLLMERFEFERFLGYGSVIDPFVDRSFGHHFDVKGVCGVWDRRFIDRVHAYDEAELHAGRLTPTHVFAVMGKVPVTAPLFSRGLTPRQCVRLSD